jgi:tetratricopeptide (TPR) repeat protein
LKKILITILLFFLIADVNFSSENILKNLIKQGIQETYSLNIDKAEEIFNKAINQYPSNPQGYLYLSQIYLWSYLGSKEEDDLKLFNTYNNLAVERIDSLLQENPNNVNTIYLNGLAYQLKAMAYTTQGSSLDAFWAAKKSVSNYEKTLEIDSTFYDSYLGLGLFDYALSFVPSFFKWALTISGLSYDKDRAL